MHIPDEFFAETEDVTREVDLIEEMPSNVVKRILKNVKAEDRKVINELIEAGKIQISDPKKSRTINTVPVTQKEIDEAKKQ